ncbi:hypothetical protein EDB85DRAFT_1895158 [Lactarius pseudohatsudake]|nr:hypothetical protein EDB85DRAFT_1895158 [Lactarius pseudohatsudake]
MSSNPITEQITSRVEEQTGGDTRARPVLTYLGPAGTYSHQCRSHATVHLTLLPQENSIFGIVTETYDLLRSSDVGESSGKTLRDIKKVLSHEQFLAANIPEAQQVSLPPRPQLPKLSRSSRTLPPTAQRSARKSVFNCSPTWNYYTRAFKTSTGFWLTPPPHPWVKEQIFQPPLPTTPLPNTRYDGRGEFNALIRLELQRKVEGLNASQDSSHPTATDLLAALCLPAIRMARDWRPSAQHELFGSVYLVEVFDNEASNASRPSQRVGEDVVTGSLLPPWKERILDGIARVVTRGGRADLLGTW